MKSRIRFLNIIARGLIEIYISGETSLFVFFSAQFKRECAGEGHDHETIYFFRFRDLF